MSLKTTNNNQIFNSTERFGKFWQLLKYVCCLHTGSMTLLT